MEKEKILWIILSVTLLVVIVLASGIYFLKPTQSKVAGVVTNGATGLQDTGFDTYEYVRGEKEPPGLEPAKEKKPQELTIVVGEKDNSTNRESANSLEKIKKSRAVTVPVKKTPLSTSSRSRVVEQSKKTKGEKRNVKHPVSRVVKEYWIQAASYSSLAKAETLRDSLSLKGVASRILTKVINGKTYYRVRIGPYKSKAEAQTFLTQIKKLKGLGNSYVSVVYSRR